MKHKAFMITLFSLIMITISIRVYYHFNPYQTIHGGLTIEKSSCSPIDLLCWLNFPYRITNAPPSSITEGGSFSVGWDNYDDDDGDNNLFTVGGTYCDSGQCHLEFMIQGVNNDWLSSSPSQYSGIAGCYTPSFNVNVPSGYSGDYSWYADVICGNQVKKSYSGNIHVSASCSDVCSPSGKMWCDGSNAMVCSDSNGDGCNEPVIDTSCGNMVCVNPSSSDAHCEVQVFCGDGSCNNGEDCNSCSQDCGACAPSCSNECVGAGCDGYFHYDCSNVDSDPCLERVNIQLVKGSCGVYCLNDNDCGVNGDCVNYNCVSAEPTEYKGRVIVSW